MAIELVAAFQFNGSPAAAVVLGAVFAAIGVAHGMWWRRHLRSAVVLRGVIEGYVKTPGSEGTAERLKVSFLYQGRQREFVSHSAFDPSEKKIGEFVDVAFNATSGVAEIFRPKYWHFTLVFIGLGVVMLIGGLLRSL